MNGVSPSSGVPAWDREGDLIQARAQVRDRAQVRAGGRDVFWLEADDSPRSQLDELEQVGPNPVVGSDLVLWTWPTWALADLSSAIAEADGLLVFVEPTAGLGLRRAIQLIGGRWFERTRSHCYRRDIPAEFRSAGFIVTTQLRLRDRFAGDYVRGEARHFPPLAPSDADS